MTAPRLAVLILSRGRVERLGACLASVRAQDLPGVDVHVLANGCPATAAFVREWHPEVRLTELPGNIGCAPGRNRLAAIAGTELLFFLDDDGELRAADILRRAVAALDADPRAGVLSLSLLNATSDEPTGWRLMLSGLDFPCYHAAFAGGASLVRRAAFERAGGYTEAFQGFGEEFDLTVRLYAAGFAVLHFPELAMHHHVDKDERRWWGELSQGYRHLQYTIARLYPPLWRVAAGWKALATQAWVTLRLNGGRGLCGDLADARAWARRGRAERRPVPVRALEMLYFAKYHRVLAGDELDRAPRRVLPRIPLWRLRRKLTRAPKLPYPFRRASEGAP